MGRTLRRLAFAAVMAWGLGLSLGAAAQAPVTPKIEEWTVPWPDTRPRDPDIGPLGNIWFVGQRGHYIGNLDPRSGAFQRIDLEPGTSPHNLLVAADGTLYYTGNLSAHIGRVNPNTGAIHKIAMPDPRARDPHTMVFDGSGNIFFTVQGGNMLGRLDPATEQVDLVAVPTRRARPYGLVIAPSGTVWATAFGSNKLLKLNPETLGVSEIILPREGARPRRLAATTDGRIWYADYAQGMLGFLHPDSGLFKEYPSPGGSASQPYAMAVDARNNVWYVESGLAPNRLVGFDPVSESFGEPVEIASGGGAVRNMRYEPEADVIWFATDTNTIGRADLSP